MNTVIEKILKLQNSDIDNIDTSYINDLINFDSSYYHLRTNSGREHYKLLMMISTFIDNQIIFDIGTNECRSAISLAYNKTNKIKSYDIIKILPQNPVLENVEYILGDSTQDQDLINSPLIFLDVDHDGLYEDVFYTHLLKTNQKGILLLDDIHLNEPMIKFWSKIDKPKYDLTHLGHWSGTGMVLLG
jgi:predicted O-methyltransferase YrrM